MDRDTLQANAVSLLERSGRLMCLWATGCGKSGVALRFLKKNPGYKALILVPETVNISNWEDEFRKFDVDISNTSIACYASLHKFADTKWDLLIIDEAPHVDTELRSSYLETIKARYVLALGAVISEDEQARLTHLFGLFAKSRMGLQEAIRYGILPPPTVNVVHMKLDDKNHHLWYDGCLLTDQGVYNAIQRKLNNAKAEFDLKPTEWNRIKINKIGSERKRFLGARKDEAIKLICDTLDKKKYRYLCFCSSIAQAKALGGERAFTSQTPTSMKLLERLNSGELNSLFVVAKLIEGQNIKNIHCGVLGQLGNSNRITVQEIGRVMRSENPIVFVPIFDNTKDEGFLYTVTNNIPQEYIKHYKF